MGRRDRHLHLDRRSVMAARTEKKLKLRKSETVLLSAVSSPSPPSPRPLRRLLALSAVSSPSPFAMGQNLCGSEDARSHAIAAQGRDITELMSDIRPPTDKSSDYNALRSSLLDEGARPYVGRKQRRHTAVALSSKSTPPGAKAGGGSGMDKSATNLNDPASVARRLKHRRAVSSPHMPVEQEEAAADEQKGKQQQLKTAREAESSTASSLSSPSPRTPRRRALSARVDGCKVCKRSIFENARHHAGFTYHAECFTCSWPLCKKGAATTGEGGEPYCDDHFARVMKKKLAALRRQQAAAAFRERQSQGAIKARDAKDSDHNVIASADFDGVKEAVADTLEANMSVPLCKMCGGELLEGEIIVSGMEKMHRECAVSVVSVREGRTESPAKRARHTPFQAAKKAPGLVIFRFGPGKDAKMWTFFLIKDEEGLKALQKTRSRSLSAAKETVEVTFRPDPQAHNGNTRVAKNLDLVDRETMRIEDQSKELSFRVKTQPAVADPSDPTLVTAQLTNVDNKVCRTLTVRFKADFAAGSFESMDATMTFDRLEDE